MPTSTKKTAPPKKNVAAAAAADPKKVVKKKRKSKSKSPRLNFSTYIYRVLKEVSQRRRCARFCRVRSRLCLAARRTHLISQRLTTHSPLPPAPLDQNQSSQSNTNIQHEQTHPAIGITKKSMGIMNDFCIDMMDKLASEAKQELLISGGGKTLKEWHFNTATKLILPGELKKHGVGEGTKAVRNYEAARAKTDVKKPSPK